MNFKNILWGVARQDGRRDIKVYVYLQGKVKYYSTGLKVLEEEWNAKSGYVKDTHPLAKTYNAKIRALRNRVEEHFLSGGNFGNFQAEENSDQYAVAQFLANFIADGEKGLLGLKEGTLKNYRATLSRLGQYEDFTGRKLYFRNIDSEFERDFAKFLRGHAACMLPGIGKHMKHIKRIMAVAQEQKLHHNESFRGFRAYKSTKSSKIFLTKAEIERLEALDLSSQPSLEAELGRFLLSYYFIQRFSDVRSNTATR